MSTLYTLTPKEIVKELDNYIIGQARRLIDLRLGNKKRKTLRGF